MTARASPEADAASARSLPWGRPRHELALLALVAISALLPVNGFNTQDQSRVCLSQALVHGHLANDRCLTSSFDKSSYGGHFYSDKAPGLSIIELPAVEAVTIPQAGDLPSFSLRLWAVRALSSGIAFLMLAFLIGRLAEGLAPGYGAVSLVSFALGTLVAPFAAANFAELPAAALGFAAFLLAWRRRALSAGLLAGAAVAVEYQAALLLVIVGIYVALRERQALLRYLLGVCPAVVLLAAYSTAAFGRPWHLSYHYIANGLADQQASGLFGIGLPHAFATYSVLSGSGGLLVVSPVLMAAAWGLLILGRLHRAEAVVCAAATVTFVFLNAGYFLPYGGVSPGPRFLIPCLPFLALGLGPAFSKAPRLTAVLGAVSIIPMTGLTLIWQTNNPLRQTVWGELARVPVELGASRFVHSLTRSVVDWIGLGREFGATLVALAALTAFVLALTTMPRGRPRSRRSGGAVIAVAVSVVLIVAADASAVLAFPYGKRSNGSATNPVALVPTIAGSTTAAPPGGEVDFTVVLSNQSASTYSGVVLTLELSEGMELLGPPAYERGSGCVGTTTITCNLDFLEPSMSTPVRLGVRIAPDAGPTETIVASAATDEVASSHSARFSVSVGS